MFLRESGHKQQADALVDRYVEAHEHAGYAFFDVTQHYVPRDERLDEALLKALARRLRNFVDDRDPMDVLRSTAGRQSWGAEDVALLAGQTPEWFEKAFETLWGRDLRRGIGMVLAIGNHGTPVADVLHDAAITALRRIASQSPLRARKLARYGIVVDAGETH